MANEMTVFGGNAPLPAWLQDMANELGDNLPNRVTVPSLGIEGKVFSINIAGESKKIMRRNEEGDEEAVPVIRTILLRYNPDRGRSYYEGAYNPAQPGKPVCFSHDSKAPDVDAGAQPPINAQTGQPVTRCDACPLSVKGSKATAANPNAVACTQHRMAAFAIISRSGVSQPLRLKMSITSLFDGRNPDAEKEGWFAFEQYLSHLKSRRVPNSAVVITKIKFDPNVPYPKLLFSMQDVIPEELAPKVIALSKSDEVADLVSGKWTPDGVNGVPAADREAEAKAKAAAEAAEVKREEEARKAKAEAEAKAKREEEARKAAKAKAAETSEDDYDLGDVGTAIPAAAEPPKVTKEKETRTRKPKEAKAEPQAQAQAPASASVDDSALAALIGDWE